MGSLGQSIRIAIVDDHPVFVEAIHRLLAAESDFEVVAQAYDGEEALEALQRHNPDILLLDLLMPRLDGFGVLQRIGALRCKTKTIVLTAVEDEAAHVLAMRYGAFGIVHKRMLTQFLMAGIRKVHRGEFLLDDRTLALVMQRVSSATEATPALSPREREVVSYVRQGLRNKEIADRLFVSEETVKSHLKHIFRKLKVNGKVQLLLRVVELGL